MLSSQTPSRIPVAFATGGTKNTIPVDSQIGVTPGRASLTDGFPPLTFTPLSAGGVPPSGADFNGILNLITALQRWQSAGGFFKRDATFSASIGGYPKGALLIKSDASGFWLCTTESNTSNPDTGGAGWVDLLEGIGGITQAQGDARYAMASALADYLTTSAAASTYAPLSSPAFIDIPTVPTAAPGTNTTQAASTAFTQAEIDSALSDFAVAYVAASQFTGANQSLSQNGYQKLPGGLIIQWGSAIESTSATDYRYFPIAFPSACFSMNLSLIKSGLWGFDSNFGVMSEIVDATKFVMSVGGSFTAGGGTLKYIAIGA